MLQDPRFSVILPVFHGGRFLAETLRSLKALERPAGSFEVLVGGRQDDEESRRIIAGEAASAAFSIRFIPAPADQKAALLNAACREARGRYWIFTDDDCLFFPDWLNQYAAAFDQDPSAGMIGGPDVLEEGASGFDRALDYVLHSPLVTGRFSLPGSLNLVKYYPKLFNMGVSRRAAAGVARAGDNGSLGVFDESLRVHEEVDLAKRIESSGLGLVFSPMIRVKHFRNTNWLDFLKRNFQLGRTCGILKVHRLPQTLLSLLLLGLVASPAAALAFGALGGTVFVIPGAYLLVLAASAAHGSLRTGSPGALTRIPGLMAGLHLSRGLGYILRPIRTTLS